MENYPCERTLYSTLKKLGFRLIKSHARQWSPKNQCGYKIVMIGHEDYVWGEHFELSIEDVMFHIKTFS